MGIDRGSYLNNFFASKKQINQFEIPNTTLSLEEQLPPSESQVSAIFERSRTKPQENNENEEELIGEKQEGNEPLKITNLKQLLRLFRQEHNTFELNGQWYHISFPQLTPASSRDVLFRQKPQSMESDTSPVNIFYSMPNSTKPQYQQNDDDIKEQEEEELGHLNTAEFNQSPVLYDAESNYRASINISQINRLVPKRDVEIQVPEPEPEQKAVQIGNPKPTKLPQRPSMEDYQVMSYEDIMKSIQLDIEEEEEDKEQQTKQVGKQDTLKPQTNINANNQVASEFDMHSKFRTAVGQSLMKSLDFSNSKNKKNDIVEELRVSDIKAFSRSVTQGGKMFMIKKDTQNMQQMSNENKMLQEQLSEALQKLETLNSLFINQQNVADAKLHFVFLFASPLVHRNQTQGSKDDFKSKMLLEFKKEFQEIKSSIRETKKVVRIKSSQATIENLTIILGQGPMALHFSGHGILNNVQNFGKQYHLQAKDGDFLLFETFDGEGELVSEKTLKELITKSKTNLEFVFVATCHSQFAGQIFLNAGANHVICIRAEQEVLDQAVITFSKCFYHNVFNTNLTICQAFDLAKAQVEVKFKKAEANKFLLLKQDDKRATMRSSLLSDVDIEEFILGEEKGKQGHQCKIFGPLKDGEIEILDKLPLFKEIPCKVDHFIGRQKEIFEVVYNVNRHRLVNIIGLPGIGKTSLAKNAVHFMSDRRMFKNGIIFIPLKGYTTCEIFIKKLLYNLIINNFECDRDEIQEYSQMNSEELLISCLQYIKYQEDELLIVFDNAEDLLYNDKLTFRNLVTDMLFKCPQIKILMTSRTIIGALQDISEKILVLKELNSRFSLDLLFSRSREIPKEEQIELLTCVSAKIQESPAAQKPKEKQISLSEHHLFELLGGNPHAIILAAPLLIKMNLKELYLMLNSKEMHEILKVDGISNSTVASLRLSLEASIKLLEKESRESLQFFFFIGLLPGGVYQHQLPELWGDGWEVLINNLLNFSLVQKRDDEDEEDVDGIKYTLPPFMSNYAEAKITEELMLEYQNLICHYYALFGKKILDRNGRDSRTDGNRVSELHHQITECLLKQEANIWACIQRMIDKPIIEFSSQNEHEEEENKLEEENEENEEARRSQGFKRFSTLFNIDKKSRLKKAQTTVLDINDLGQESPVKQPSQVDEVQIKTNEGTEQKEETFKQEAQSQMSTYKVKTMVDKRNSVKVQMLNTNKLVLENQNSNVFSAKLNQVDIEIEHDDEDSSNSSVNLDNEEALQQQQVVESGNLAITKTNIPNDKDEDSPNRKASRSIVPEASPSLLEKEKEEKLESIVRNSIIRFSRPSGNLALNKVKNFESRGVSLQRRSTIMYQQQKMQTKFGKNATLGQLGKKKIETLHAAEQMILYYALNLVLLREQDNALHLLQECAAKVKGSTLYEANLKRIEGMIWYYKQSIDKAIDCFKQALGLYEQSNSLYGEALSYFSLGFIYRSKVSFFLRQTDEDVIYSKAEKKYQKAYNLFKQINHVVGNAQCNKELALIYDKKDKKKSFGYSKEFLRLMQTFQKHKDTKNCVHISRVHGHEISLMSEIVLDNDNRNLFPSKILSKQRNSKEKSKEYNEQIFDDIEYTHQKSVGEDGNLQDNIDVDSMKEIELVERANSSDNVFERKSVDNFSPESIPDNNFENQLTQKVSKALGHKMEKIIEDANEEDQDDEQVKLKKKISNKE